MPYGSSIVVSDNTLTINETIITASPKEITGYTTEFSNWDNALGTITEARTITANFTSAINSFTVTFEVNDTALGTVSPTKIENVPYGTAITVSDNKVTIHGTTVTATSKEITGSTVRFLNWTNATGTIISARTITANFTSSENTYTITYKDQGNVAFSGTHENGYPTTHTYGTPTTLKSASKTGYDFLGWYKEVDCSGEALTSLGATEFTVEITLYAKWQIKKYTLTIEITGNGEVSPSTNIEVEYGASQEFILTANTGYELNNILIDNEDISSQELENAKLNGKYTIENVVDNHTIKVEFSVLTYTLTYNLNYEIQSKTQNYNYGETIVLIETPERVGYTFSGWFNESDCINEFTLIQMPANDLTIYAKWIINTFTVTFEVNDTTLGTVSSSKIENVPYGSTITENRNEVTINGTTITAITKAISGSTVRFLNWTNAEGEIIEARTIIANFSSDANEYNISYNANGGNGSISSQTIIFGSNITLSKGDNFTKTGHHLTGWNTQSDGNGTHYELEYTFNPYNLTTDLLLYAQWEVNKYTITITKIGNGSINPSTSIEVDYGENQEITFAADTGYELSNILIDGMPTNSIEIEQAKINGKYTLQNITSNLEITIQFDLKLFTITYVLSHELLQDITQEYNFGELIVLPNTPYRENYIYFEGWYDNYDGNIFTNKHEFTTMPAQDIVVYGKFELREYRITATTNGKGTTTPENQNIVYPNSGLFILTPNAGYVVKDIKVDDNSISLDELLTVRESGEFEFIINKYDFSLKDNSEFENHTIYVEFSPMPFTLTFNLNYVGAINEEREFETEEIIEFPEDPERIGYTFAGWYEESECINEFRLTQMPAYDLTVFAKWEIKTYTITATCGENGTISPSGIKTVNYNESVTYTFTPNEGYYVLKIEIDGVELSETEFLDAIDNGYPFDNIDANHTINVEFNIISYTIIAETNGYGTITPEGESYYNHGDSQIFTILPNEGYHIDKILIDDVEENINIEDILNNGYIFTNITKNHTIYVEFGINTYTITAISGENGTINPNGLITKNHGENLKIEFNPDRGYELSNILIDDNELDSALLENAKTQGYYTLTNIDKDYTIYAEFSVKTYTIKASCGINGDITPKGDISADFDSNLIISITPNIGYQISSILVDGNFVIIDENIKFNGYVFKNIDNNHAIYVEFSPITYTLRFDFNYNGLAEETGFTIGETIVFPEIAERIGYTFAGWYEESECINEFTLTQMPANNLTIYAMWNILSYTISATSGENGTISPDGITSVNYNDSLTYTFTPNEGYYVLKIEIDGVELSETQLLNAIENGYPFENINDNHTINVEFDICKYKITVSIIGDGNIICDDDLIDIVFGEDRLFKIETDFDLYNVKIYVNDELFEVNGDDFIIENIHENIHIKAKFIKKSFLETNLYMIIIVSTIIVLILLVIIIVVVKKKKKKKRRGIPLLNNINVKRK